MERQLAEQSPPPLVMVLPFVLMLGAIAILPMLHGAKHWWDSNLHRFYVCGGIGIGHRTLLRA